MNIRTRVKLSFVLVVALLCFLGFLSSVITYQIKENSHFRESVADILVMQEGMNEVIYESTQTQDLAKLEALHVDFGVHESHFESLREMLSLNQKAHLFNWIIPNLRDDETSKKYLNELYGNEHRIEVMYDEIFTLEKTKLERMEIFNALYPEENRARLHIQEHVLAHNNVAQIKALSDLRYYSKETLYQHSDEKTLQKWLFAVQALSVENEHNAFLNDLLAYQKIVQAIGEKAIAIEETKKIEDATLRDTSNVLKSNKKLSLALESRIADLSEGFIEKVRWIQLILGVGTIGFVLILAFKVSRHVSLTMDEVEAKIEEGLKEVNALNQEIEDTQREVLFTMGSIGESRSKETGNHVRRVAEYTEILARHYGLSEEETQMLKLASPMHDIGKVAIADAILNKPGRFDEEERRIMERHAMFGYEMLKHSQRPLLKTAAIVAKEHHEKWDGTGYPEGKSGENIHIYGRISALADVFDALGSARVYKPAWDDEKIFALFKAERGKHFDPKLVDIFFEHLESFLHVRKMLQDV